MGQNILFTSLFDLFRNKSAPTTSSNNNNNRLPFPFLSLNLFIIIIISNFSRAFYSLHMPKEINDKSIVGWFVFVRFNKLAVAVGVGATRHSTHNLTSIAIIFQERANCESFFLKLGLKCSTLGSVMVSNGSLLAARSKSTKKEERQWRSWRRRRWGGGGWKKCHRLLFSLSNGASARQLPPLTVSHSLSLSLSVSRKIVIDTGFCLVFCFFVCLFRCSYI